MRLRLERAQGGRHLRGVGVSATRADRRPRLRRAGRRVSNARRIPGPVLVHVHTVKGRASSRAELDARTFHGVGPFEVENGKIEFHADRSSDVFRGVRRRADEPRGRGRPDHRDHGGDAGWHEALAASPRATPSDSSTSASPKRTRCALRPAPRPPDCGPSARSTRPSCSAPTTKSSTTSSCKIYRWSSRSTAPVSPATTARPTWACTTSRTCARCPT